MLTLVKLSKSFGNKIILNELDFEFKGAHIYGIIGKNGVGKTTLLSCIAGIEAYSGKIMLDLKHRNVGFLETIPSTLPLITAQEYLTLMCVSRKKGTEKIQRYNFFNLPLNQYMEEYSIGMKKKLAITALLIQENDIYLLDEPFNGIDIEGNIIVIEIIKRLKYLDKTVILSSHILSSLKDICDTTLLIENKTIYVVDKPIDSSCFTIDQNLYNSINSMVF
ncbi:MAG: ATP-binding cassette domain-containing protein [Bacteroidia bacterium]